jgi:hypothetical protein
MPRNRKPRQRGGTLRKRPPPPGPAKCSPLAATRRAGASCLPANVLSKIKQRNQSTHGYRGGQMCAQNDGRCIVQNSALSEREKKHLLQTWFRPPQPAEWKQKPDTWLTSEDIHAVMKQFEAAHPCFKFIGVVPIDFSAPDPYTQGQKKCMNPEFCTVDLAEERAKGREILGAVFNLDPHYEGGSHWVALAVDLKRNKAYYFDSYGMKPPEQVARYMRYLTTMEPNLVLESNGRRFQYSDTECGVYSMYFLYCMMQGESFKAFCRNPIRDEWMYNFRNVFFDPEASA